MAKPSDRAYAVLAAAARDVNDELTVILNAVSEACQQFEEGHPAEPRLAEIQDAAQRLTDIAELILQYSDLRGARPSAVSVRALIDAA